MSIDSNTYVGPVLICEKVPTEAKYPYEACSGESCPLYKKKDKVKGMFCYHCGSKVINFLETKNILIPTYQQVSQLLYEKLDEDTLIKNCFINIKGNYDVFMPNNYLGSKPSRDMTADHPKNFSLFSNDFDIEKEILWFNETYHEYIKEFSTLYKSVEVKWGFFNYQS